MRLTGDVMGHELCQGLTLGRKGKRNGEREGKNNIIQIG